MSARKLQSKLFGAVKEAKDAAKDAVTRECSKSLGSASLTLPASAKKDAPATDDNGGSGAATPVPAASAAAAAAAPEGPLKINIPAPITAAPSAAQVQK